MYTTGNNLTDCLEFASLAGAVNTTRPGGIAAFRDRETFLTIAVNSFGYSFP
jgi:sugar/nucleoside kinase (ribokinase family)